MPDTPGLTATAGKGGTNRPTDVRTVQLLLNKRISELNLKPLDVNGIAGSGDH